LYLSLNHDTLISHHYYSSSFDNYAESKSICSNNEISLVYSPSTSMNGHSGTSLYPGGISISDVANPTHKWQTDTTKYAFPLIKSFAANEIDQLLNIDSLQRDSALVVFNAIDSGWDSLDSTQHNQIAHIIPSQRLAFCNFDSTATASWEMVFNVSSTNASEAGLMSNIPVRSHKNIFLTSPISGDTLLKYSSPLSSWDSVPTLNVTDTARCMNGNWKVHVWSGYFREKYISFTNRSDSTKIISLTKN